MPTPMPIIDATWAVKSGVCTTFDQSVTQPSAVTMPAIAVTIGRPMATTEPNAIEQDEHRREDAEHLAGRRASVGEAVTEELDLSTPVPCIAVARSQQRAGRVVVGADHAPGRCRRG